MWNSYYNPHNKLWMLLPNTGQQKNKSEQMLPITFYGTGKCREPIQVNI